MPTLEELWAEHHQALHRYLGRVLPAAADAEDLLHEVFVRAAGGLGRYRERGTARAWLFTIARRLLLDRKKQQARRPELLTLGESHEEQRDTELGVALRRALEALPGDERELFLLRELGGLSYVELATVTATSENAVRSRLYRARRALRSELAPLESSRGGPR